MGLNVFISISVNIVIAILISPNLFTIKLDFSIISSHWIKTFSHSGATITVTGYKKGETKADGSIQEEVVMWDTADNSGDWAGTTATIDIDATTAANRGYGDGYYEKVD